MIGCGSALSLYKQALILRKDLKMGAGKAAVQAAHASVEAVLLIVESRNAIWKKWLEEWRSTGAKKIALRVDSLRELVDRYNSARILGVPSSFIRDAGLTQLEPGTPTAVAVGPAPAYMVDRVTGDLKLY